MVDESNETGYVKKIVKEEGDIREPIRHELWIVKNEEAEIAVEVKKQNNEIYQKFVRTKSGELNKNKWGVNDELGHCF